MIGNNIIDRISAHIESDGRRLPVASEKAVEATETTLGLRIPTLLRSIYLNVANGGFGPGYGVVVESDSGYGIIGVSGGHPSSFGTLVETSKELQRGADYLGLKWNQQLLPFCELGGAVLFCVDCSSQDSQIFLCDHCKVTPVGYGLEEFFERWLDGRDLFDKGKRRAVEMINPFTGKKTRVKSNF